MLEISNVNFQQALVDRGVNPALAEQLVPALPDQALLDTIAWFDAQGGRVGAGVLVAELRAGGRPAPRRVTQASLLQEQERYGKEIAAWLQQHFSDLERPRWGPHPAAVAAVIRLHHRHGRGRLSAKEHGAEIRAAVRRHNLEYAKEV